jgi:hypothetical protein
VFNQSINQNIFLHMITEWWEQGFGLSSWNSMMAHQRPEFNPWQERPLYIWKNTLALWVCFGVDIALYKKPLFFFIRLCKKRYNNIWHKYIIFTCIKTNVSIKTPHHQKKKKRNTQTHTHTHTHRGKK